MRRLIGLILILIFIRRASAFAHLCTQVNGCNCSIGMAAACCCQGIELVDVPSNLTINLQYLRLQNVGISNWTMFFKYSSMRQIQIVNAINLRKFDSTYLNFMPKLYELSINGCPNFTEVVGNLLERNTRILKLDLSRNALTKMPHIRMSAEHRTMDEIDLSDNKIELLQQKMLVNLNVRNLRLDRNNLHEIGSRAFAGSKIANLLLRDNPALDKIASDAFSDVEVLHKLDLSNTALTEMPSAGLRGMKTLKIQGVPSLKVLPSVDAFVDLERADFTYSHHCCLFQHVEGVMVSEDGLVRHTDEKLKPTCVVSSSHTQRRRRFIDLNEPVDDDSSSDYDAEPYGPDDLGKSIPCVPIENITRRARRINVTCTPVPDALNPCENIVGYPVLRVAIWVVWIGAVVGNVLVWIILAIAHDKRMRVHYFYMLNLSVADMLTAIYLGMLAFEDVWTADEYYRHAADWQTGWGCSIAGFIAIFASQLSIVSMFLIAFEIAYNTKRAFYGQRLSFRVAVLAMVGGYAIAFTSAALPFFGVSSYKTTSICLPLSIQTAVDKVYILFGLAFNLVAFFAMAICYFVIMKILRNPETPSRPEDRQIIAKMALLIVTDMFCWFPTVFFGATATMYKPLISISEAKIFLVFFFPINAFANPFLYVFFTKVNPKPLLQLPQVIQRNVKSKTVPVFRSIARIPSQAITSLSNFYNGGPEEHHNQLGVTQMTSLMSSPRGSGSSQRTGSATEHVNCQETIPKRSSPRVSFQDEQATVHSEPSSSSSRRRPHRAFGFLKKVSASPEVSDLSEHSSESHHEHMPRPSRRRASALFNLGGRRRSRQESGGGDSGRGSLASSSAPGERASSPCSEASSRKSSQCESAVDEGREETLELLPSSSTSSSLSKDAGGVAVEAPPHERSASPLHRPRLVISDYSDR